MFQNNAEIKQFFRVSVFEIACVAVMLGIYAVIGKLTGEVIIGAVCGTVLALGNFLALTITVTKAADKAVEGDPVKAKVRVQGSSTVRLLILAACYVILLRADVCDPIAAILPLPFVQISITLMEFFRKRG